MRLLFLPLLLGLLAACEPMQWPADVRLPDGAVYDGDFKDELFHGQGTLTWPDGRQYRGQFREGRIHGEGQLVDRQGCAYQGHFENGVLNGDGLFTCEGRVYQGEFQKGEIRTGTVTFQDGGSYQGAFEDFSPHGQGLWTTVAGDQYQGQFENGAMVKGEYRGASGHHYQGTFQGFFFHGEGRLSRPDGVVIDATFEHGQAQGSGQRQTPREGQKPQVEKGYFVNGEFFDSERAYRQRKQQQAANMEARLYTESSRLQSILASLAPQRPGVRDVYMLIVGGDGDGKVFSREADWVTQQLTPHFSLKSRHVTLVNGGADEQPLATRTSIRESLEALDALMDPSEDLLLVHLVSHGTQQGALLLQAPTLALNNLTVADGKQWLDQLAVEHQLLVVSSCYSGHWVAQLAAPKRAVFSSAARERTSFGCDTRSKRTWFSQALYGDALEQTGTDDLAAWFAAAREAVLEEEQAQGVAEEEQSLPQHRIGKAFARWWRNGAIRE